MRPSTLLSALSLCAVLFTAATTDAQCSIRGATFKPYGQGCSGVGFQIPPLTGSFNQAACTISLKLDAFKGCCNTYLSGRMLLFGTSQLRVPLPWLGGASCNLLVNPQFSVFWAPVQGSTLTINLPRNMGPGTVHVQGITRYFYTLGMRSKYQMSKGLTVQVW